MSNLKTRFFTVKDGKITSCIKTAKTLKEAYEEDNLDSDDIIKITPEDFDWVRKEMEAD